MYRYINGHMVLAGAMMGACLGFLWFNCNPAAVFMGDTGSLALGGLIGGLVVGLGLTFLLEMQDTSLRTEREVEVALRLPISCRRSAREVAVSG